MAWQDEAGALLFGSRAPADAEAVPSPQQEAADEEMARLLFPQQPAAVQQEPNSWGRVLAAAAMRGAGNLADLAEMAGPAGATRRALAGLGYHAPTQRQMLEGGVQGVTGFDARAADAQPSTTAQRYAAAATEGAVGGAPFGIAGALAGAAGGALGEGAAPLAGNLYDATIGGPNRRVAEELGRLAGNVVGGAAAPGVANTAGRFFTRATGPAAAFERAGVTPIPAFVSSSPATAQATTAVGRLPGGGRVEQAVNGSLEQFASAIDNAAASLTARTIARGQVPSPQAAGAAIQQGAEQWLTQFRSEQTRLWDGFFNAIPNNVRARLPNTRGLVADGALRREMPGMADVLEEPGITGFMQILRANPQSISAPALRDFRTMIGQRLENAPLIGDPNIAAYRRMYGALSEDLRGLAAQGGGQRALDALERANTYSREGHNLVERVASNLIGRGDRRIDPEVAYRWATAQARIGDSRLAGVQQVAGRDALDAVAGTALREAGQPSPFAAGARGGGPPVSARGVNAYLESLSPEARARLYANAPRADDLRTVAARMVNADRYTNRSNTGSVAGWSALGTGFTGSALAGSPLGVLSSIAVPGMNWTAARALTSPALARHLSRAPVTGMTGAEGAGIAALPSLLGNQPAPERAMRRFGLLD